MLEDWDRFRHDPSHYGGGAPSPQKTQYEWQEVDHLVFTYCVVDVLQNEELGHYAGRDGPKGRHND